MLFTYGIVPVALLVGIYVIVSKYEFKKGRYLFVAILSLIAINCMIEAFWFVPTYNIFMFTLFATEVVKKKPLILSLIVRKLGEFEGLIYSYESNETAKSLDIF